MSENPSLAIGSRVSPNMGTEKLIGCVRDLQFGPALPEEVGLRHRDSALGRPDRFGGRREDDRRQQMIVQIPADLGTVQHHRDAELLEFVGRADA